MEHTNEQNLNTERYLLDEMPAGERAAFEEHFFNCKACGEDVTAAARMFAAGHEIAVAEENGKVVPLPRGGWRQWFPQSAAAAVVSAFLTFFAMRPAPVPLVVDTDQHEVPTVQVRSGAVTAPVRTTVPTTLIIPTPYSEEASGWYYSVRNAKGETLLAPEKPLSLEPSPKPVTIHLLRELPRGSYEVVIEGVRKTDGNRFLITRSTYEVVGER